MLVEGFILGIIENRIQNYLSREDLDSATKGKIIQELKHLKGEVENRPKTKIIVYFKTGQHIDFLSDGIEIINSLVCIKSDRTHYFNIDNIDRIEEVENDKQGA